MGGRDADTQTEASRWADGRRCEIARLRRSMDGERLASQPLDADDSSSPYKSSSERFKDFVDHSLGFLSDGLRNFPSNISELKARMQQERDARRDEEREIWRRWTGSEDSPDFIRMQVERSSGRDRERDVEAAEMLVRESLARNKDVAVEKAVKLFEDGDVAFGNLDGFAAPMLSFGGACYYKPETVENLPSTARWGWPAPKQRWLSVGWFKRDPYSPIRLEACPELSSAGSKWRAAFEDLLSVSLDKPMVSEEKVGVRPPHGNVQSTYKGPGLEWMLSLQCRGILPPQLPSLYKVRGDRYPATMMGFEPNLDVAIDACRSRNCRTSFRGLALSDDLLRLVREVAIKSKPMTEAEPLKIQQTAWRVPETEQELYEQMLPHPPEAGMDSPTASLETDLEQAEQRLVETSRNEDLFSMATLLAEFRRAHGDESQLVDRVRRRLESEPMLQYKFEDLLDEYDELSAAYDDPLGVFPNVEIGEQQMEEKRNALVPAEDRSPARDEGDEELSSPTPDKGLDSAPKPDVLSQLTTTETIRSPDGRITTKVVLKQKFADGREECRESVHTQHEPSTAPQAEQAKETPQRARGWFWS